MTAPYGYCTTTDLAQLGVRAEALSSISSGVQQAAITAASEQMDGYFRARYELPDATPGYLRFVSWGADVKRACAILAVYDLMVVRGYNPGAGADENLRQRYEDTLRWLELVAAQKIQPNVTPRQHESAGYDQPSITTSTPRGW